MAHDVDPEGAPSGADAPRDDPARARLRLGVWIVGVLLVVGGGIAFLLAQVPGAPPRVQVVGGTSLELRTVPPELTAGPATLRLAVRGLDGRPIRGAKVSFNVGMDAMPSMGAAKDLEARETENGLYTVPFVFPMVGTWDVCVRAEIPGETSQERHFVIAVR